MKCEQNKYLTLRGSIDLTETIDEVIFALDESFSNYPAEVTSGLRTAGHQLELIQQKCSNHGISKDFPSILNATVDNVDSWLKPWGKLLTIGEMINPPVPARAPFDYTKPGGEKRNAGNLIGISNHMQGHAFDIGLHNQKTGKMLDLQQLVMIIGEAAKTLGLIAGYLPEPVNGALHIDCKDMKLKSF